MKAGQAKSVSTLQTKMELVDERQKQIRLLFLGHAHLVIGDSPAARAAVAPVLLQQVLRTRDQEIDSSRKHLLSLVSGAGLTSEDESSLFRSELDLAIAA
jgi:hypothetical protein